MPSIDHIIDQAIAREQAAIDNANDTDNYITGLYRINYHPDTHEFIGVQAYRKPDHD